METIANFIFKLTSHSSIARLMIVELTSRTSGPRMGWTLIVTSTRTPTFPRYR